MTPNTVRASVGFFDRVCQMCDSRKGTVAMLLCRNQSEKKRIAKIFVPYIMTVSRGGCECDLRELNLLACYKEPVVVSFANKSVIYITTEDDKMPSVKSCANINSWEVMLEKSHT